MQNEKQMAQIEARIKSGEYADNGRSIGGAWRAFRTQGLFLGHQYSRLRRRFNWLAKMNGYTFKIPAGQNV